MKKQVFPKLFVFTFGILFISFVGVFYFSSPEKAEAAAGQVWGAGCSAESFTTNIGWNYTMGYKFTPSQNGRVTNLCGYFNGTKTVKLYNSSYSVLSTASVISANSWSCTVITPVEVTSGSVYYVAVYLGSSGGAYQQPIPALPRTCGSVVVNTSVYEAGNSFSSSRTEVTSYMYGVADVVFFPVYNLSVSLTGAGTGTVTSTPPGINCGADCSELYASGIAVALTASPQAGSIFSGWSGDCTGTGTCNLIMNSPKSATTTFTLNQPPVISSVLDSPDPVVVGNQITFTAYWSDPNGDTTKTHFCKTNAISGQTCSGGSWCDSTAFSPTSPTSCSSTVQLADVGNKNYYAFVCDNVNNCSASVAGTFNVIVPCTQHNVLGWAWSNMNDPATPADERSIGWISFSCKNCDTDNNGYIDSGACGGDNLSTSTSDYGVDINAAAGNFSGYTWSENIGWIDFAPARPYPALPNYPACLEFPGAGQACDGIGNYNIGGWARACAVFQTGCSGTLRPDNERGGWDGWIKMAGDGASWNGTQCEGKNDYGNTNRCNWGVKINTTNGELSGYAWSDMIIGWISFNDKDYDGAPGPIDYQVKTTFPFNQPPAKPTTEEVDWNRCAFKGEAIPTFSWVYSDPEGNPQTAYEIEVDEDAAFNDPKFNHLVTDEAGASLSYALNLRQDDDLSEFAEECEDPADALPEALWDCKLDWDTRYWWHVRVKDSLDNWSDWSNPRQSETAEYPAPWIIFTFTPATPTEPTLKETVEFDASPTETFGGTPTYLWTIIQGNGIFVDGTDNDDIQPHIQFSTINNTVRLTVDDGVSSCYKDENITVQPPLPEYKEVPPVIWLKKIFTAILSFFKF